MFLRSRHGMEMIAFSETRTNAATDQETKVHRQMTKFLQGFGRISACVMTAGLILAVISPDVLRAQGSAASLSGTVTDSSGATVPDAAIQAKNLASSVTQSTTSDSQGRFRLPDLGIGDYEVQASKAGFQTLV